ncbi:hypothetical protein [Paenibacillus sp. FSL H7-0714]|uniref:hypothetical protein n=1 Tax=Paenibacillus sp. FSL H7-0714 TaxID=2954735 RepID=UPI0030F74501
MKIEGTHKCNSTYKDCDHTYEWMVQIATHSSAPEVEVFDKPTGRIIETLDNKYSVKIICPKCHQDNLIEYIRN